MRRAGESFLPSEVVWRQGWDYIGWSFASTFIQKRAVWIIEQIEAGKALLDRYVDYNIPECAVKNGNDVPVKDEESIWCIFHLLYWLQFNMQNGIIHDDYKE